jgi:hypothetical protein
VSELGDVGPDEAFDLDLATTSLLADNRDIQALLRVLVKQFSSAFGDRLHVERKGGLLRKSEEIRSIEVALGNDDFLADASGSSLICSVGHSSGGIRIRSQKVEIEEWLRRLLGALQSEAAHSQNARLALENIVIGGPA